jgi:hypothetical protein
MAKGDQINIRPHFKKEGPSLPCDGAVGDFYVFTPLNEGERDPNRQGSASLWFCIKDGPDAEGQNAVWARVQFDGIATCADRLPIPPQNHPVLKDG